MRTPTSRRECGGRDCGGQPLAPAGLSASGSGEGRTAPASPRLQAGSPQSVEPRARRRDRGFRLGSGGLRDAPMPHRPTWSGLPGQIRGRIARTFPRRQLRAPCVRPPWSFAARHTGGTAFRAAWLLSARPAGVWARNGATPLHPIPSRKPFARDSVQRGQVASIIRAPQRAGTDCRRGRRIRWGGSTGRRGRAPRPAPPAGWRGAPPVARNGGRGAASRG